MRKQNILFLIHTSKKDHKRFLVKLIFFSNTNSPRYWFHSTSRYLLRKARTSIYSSFSSKSFITSLYTVRLVAIYCDDVIIKCWNVRRYTVIYDHASLDPQWGTFICGEYNLSVCLKVSLRIFLNMILN